MFKNSAGDEFADNERPHQNIAKRISVRSIPVMLLKAVTGRQIRRSTPCAPA
jgi:hypothetical protein